MLRKLRQAAAEQPITSYRANNARRVLRVAAAFLAALAERCRRLDECTQADLDRWFATHKDQHSRDFVRWCCQQREIPRLRLPPVAQSKATPLGHLALLILLYAQPLIRIARLTIDDVLRDEGQVLIRLGDPPTPVPKPSPTC